jgi:hypothetical protein
MEKKIMRGILIITIIIIGIFLILMIFDSTRSHATSDEFNACYRRCLLDIPTVEECIINDDGYWDMGYDKKKLLRRECTAIVKNEKLNCKLDCYSQSMKPQNPRQQRAIEFWDKSVRSFPETNE